MLLVIMKRAQPFLYKSHCHANLCHVGGVGKYIHITGQHAVKGHRRVDSSRQNPSLTGIPTGSPGFHGDH